MPKVTAIDFGQKITELTQGFTGREWVFEQIDYWLKHKDERFFILTGEPGVGKSAIAAYLIQIRNDIAAYHFCIAGRSGTIEPNNVLLSLAAQLIKYFPDYGEALVNTIKPLHLSVKVEITVETIKDSSVQGVVIENLHPGDPQKALNIVLRQSLEALPHHPKQPILILIDSLDEAVTHNDQTNLVTLLSGVNDLPSWVRFILTTRPDEKRVLSSFYKGNLKPYRYHLDELSQNNLSDIYQYVTSRVDTENVILQLQKFQVEPQALVTQLTDLSKGNFLYTKILLNDIETGGQPLDNLSALPQSLDEFYHGLLLRFKSKWEYQYQPILGTLTVTKAPLTEEQIANIVNFVNEEIGETELRQSLKIVQQLLDVVPNEQGCKTYALFHKSIRDYLVDKERSDIFWCSPKDWHQRIVDFYWENYHPHNWNDCDLYGLQYLPTHLVDAASWEKLPKKAKKYIEKLHELLAAEINQKNVWFETKKLINDIKGYVADIALAWQIAEKEFTTSSSSNEIVRQCRYALITSSINSLIEIPTELLIELMKKDQAKGLAYFQQLRFNQQEQNLQVLSGLKSHDLEPELVQKLLQEVETISSKNYQTQVKCAIAQFLPKELLPKVLEAAKAIRSEKDRVQALTMLVPYLSKEQQAEVLLAAGEISDQYNRSQVLNTLAQYLPANVLEMLQEIEYGHYRADVLIALAPHLPQELLQKALAVALDAPIANEYSWSRSLSGLATAPKLTVELVEKIQKAVQAFQQDFRTQVLITLTPHLPPDQLPEVLQLVQAIQYEHHHQTQILIKLASHLPSQLHVILKTAHAIVNQEQKDLAVSGLVSYLPLEQLHQILDEIKQIQNEYYRALALGNLAHQLPEEELYKVLDEVVYLQDEYYQALALSEIATAPRLIVDLVENILQQANNFESQNNRILVMTALAKYLSKELLQEVLEEIQTIQDRFDRALALISLMSNLPPKQLHQRVHQVLDHVNQIQQESERAWALSELIHCLSQEQLHNVLNLVKQFEQEDYKFVVLSKLATSDNLSVDLVEKIQLAANEFLNQDCRTQVQSALTKYLTEESRQEVLEAAMAIENGDDLVQALSALAPHLSREQQQKTIEQAGEIDDEYRRAQVLCALATHLPTDLQQLVIHKAWEIDDEYRRAQVLSELATSANLSVDLVEKIQQQVKTFQDQHCQIRVKSALTPHLPLNQRSKLLMEVQAIQDEFERTQALKTLIPHLSLNQLEEVLKMTLVIQNEFNRANTLELLAPQLSKLPRLRLHELWVLTLHSLASCSRTDFLLNFRQLTPVISALGKDEAVVRICDVIEDIGQKWP